MEEQFPRIVRGLCILLGVGVGMLCLLIVLGGAIQTDSGQLVHEWCDDDFETTFQIKIKESAENDMKLAVMHFSHDLLDVAFAKKDTALNIVRHYFHIFKCYSIAALEIISSLLDVLLTILARHSFCTIHKFIL